MNIKPVISTIKAGTMKVLFVLRKKSPDILLGLGLTTGLATTVTACYATSKAAPKYKQMRNAVKKIEASTSDSLTKKKAVREKKLECASDIVKDYAGAAALGLVSGSSILASHHIIKQRNVALAAAYVTLDQGFKAYRKNVVDELGDDADTRFLTGTKCISEIDLDTGEITEGLVVKDDPNLRSDYACYFDNRSCNYDQNNEFNMMFLNCKQHYANDKLVSNRYLFLNDVYSELGLPKTKMGQVVGWMYDPNNPKKTGDGYVDFRIKVVKFKNENGIVEDRILLDFNVDGPIIDICSY